MLSITRKVEYALMGLTHMAAQEAGAVVTVREIAAVYGLPGALLAKVFHQLRTARFLHSHQGKHGGYSLARDPADVTLTEVISAIESPPNLVLCLEENGQPCPQEEGCNIRDPMVRLNRQLRDFLDSVTIETLGGQQKPVHGV